MVAALVAAGSAMGAGAQAAEPVWRFSSALDYTSGNYGEETPTEVLSVPFTVRRSASKWSFRASIPYLTIRGPSDLIIADDADSRGGTGGGDPGAAPGHARPSTRQGFGDTTVAATYYMRRLRGTHAYLNVTGRVRLPTGNDEKGLSTQAVDSALNAELGGDWRKGGAYVNVGRRFFGDSPLYVREDGWTASTGGWVNRGRNEYGAYVSWRESPFINGTDPAEVGAYAATRINKNWRLQISGLAGLNDASPDYGFALGFSYRTSPGRN
ncbi:MAG: transporter [Caulobacteraceae bacterium]